MVITEGRSYINRDVITLVTLTLPEISNILVKLGFPPIPIFPLRNVIDGNEISPPEQRWIN